MIILGMLLVLADHTLLGKITLSTPALALLILRDLSPWHYIGILAKCLALMHRGNFLYMTYLLVLLDNQTMPLQQSLFLILMPEVLTTTRLLQLFLQMERPELILPKLLVIILATSLMLTEALMIKRKRLRALLSTLADIMAKLLSPVPTAL